MKTKTRRRILVFPAIAVLLSAGSVSAQMVANGDFELDPDPVTGLLNPSGSMVGWSSVNGDHRTTVNHNAAGLGYSEPVGVFTSWFDAENNAAFIDNYLIGNNTAWGNYGGVVGSDLFQSVNVVEGIIYNLSALIGNPEESPIGGVNDSSLSMCLDGVLVGAPLMWLCLATISQPRLRRW